MAVGCHTLTVYEVETHGMNSMPCSHGVGSWAPHVLDLDMGMQPHTYTAPPILFLLLFLRLFVCDYETAV